MWRSYSLLLTDHSDIKTLVNWLIIGILLVTISRLVEENAVQVFHNYCFHLSSSYLIYNFQDFSGKIIMWKYSVSFLHLRVVGHLGVHPPWRIDSHPREQEIALTSTWSFVLREGRWHLVEGKSLSRVHLVLSYVSCLRRCSLSSARSCW